MERLRKNGMIVNLQILDNEVSTKFKHLITEELGINYQLVPPYIHRRNAAEQAIRTFKPHFLSILAGIVPNLPKFLWYHLFPQTEMTLNFLRKSTLDPTKSAWEFFNAAFDYAATPIGPLGCRIIIHKKPSVRNSWDIRWKDGWSLGCPLEHYRRQRVAPKDTKAVQVSDTLEYCHHYLTQPTLTPEDRVLHVLQTLTCAIEEAPIQMCDEQLRKISALHNIFGQWTKNVPTYP